LQLLTTIAATVLVLGVLIFVHELGHFLAAKSVGIAVLRFSFGLGPVTPLRFKRGETEYCVSWVPFGGYVKMAGLEEQEATGAEGPSVEEANVPEERTFDAKPLWARVYVISAGVIMNALFAVVTYAVLAGLYGSITDPTTTVHEVRQADLPVGAGHLASLNPGDRIIRVNGDTVTQWDEMLDLVIRATRLPIRIEVAGRAQPVLLDVASQEARVVALSAVVARHEPVLGDVLPNRPAGRAGLQSGDRIVRAGGDTILAWEDLVRKVEASPGRELPLGVLRGQDTLTIAVTPAPTPLPAARGSVARTVGKIGAGPYFPRERFGPIGAIGEGFRRAGAAGGMVLFTLKGLLTGSVSPRELGGPILVGQLSGEMARLGMDALFGFMALFSMNLAILNLLPIPVLDGGHLLFMAIEAIRRRPLSINQRQRLTQVGFFVLLAIMILALSNDLMRVFRGLF